MVRSASDATVSADAAVRVTFQPRHATDLTVSADLASRTLRAPRSSVDSSFTVDDAFRGGRDFRRSGDDSTDTDDAVRLAFDRTRAAADVTFTSDAVVLASRTFLRSGDDVAISTDTAEFTGFFGARFARDGSNTADHVARTVVQPLNASDTSLSADSATWVYGVHVTPRMPDTWGDVRVTTPRRTVRVMTAGRGVR
jgi:hypothetical protein